MAVRRPNNHRQRRMCLEAADGLRETAQSEGEALPEAIETVLRVLFTPVRDRYVAARKAYRGALAARFAAVRAVAEAERAFDRTGREWNKGVTDGEGRHIPREFAKLFEGILPGALFGLSYRKKIDLTQNLSERLEHFPHLQGDPKELADFLAAHTALAEAVAALEAAQRTHRACKATLEAATLQFDRKWMALVEVVEESSPTLASRCLPDFPSRSKKARQKRAEAVLPEAAVLDELDDIEELPDQQAEAAAPVEAPAEGGDPDTAVEGTPLDSLCARAAERQPLNFGPERQAMSAADDGRSRAASVWAPRPLGITVARPPRSHGATEPHGESWTLPVPGVLARSLAEEEESGAAAPQHEHRS